MTREPQDLQYTKVVELLTKLEFTKENEQLMDKLVVYDNYAYIALDKYESWMHPMYSRYTKKLGKLIDENTDFAFLDEYEKFNLTRGFKRVSLDSLEVPSFEACVLFILATNDRVHITKGDVTPFYVDARDGGYGQVYLPYDSKVLSLIEKEKPFISQNSETLQYSVQFKGGKVFERESLFKAATLAFISTKLDNIELPTYLKYCNGPFTLNSNKLIPTK